jgi:hypothetical protein
MNADAFTTKVVQLHALVQSMELRLRFTRPLERRATASHACVACDHSARGERSLCARKGTSSLASLLVRSNMVFMNFGARHNKAVNADTHVLACVPHTRLMGAGYLQRYASASSAASSASIKAVQGA